MHVCRPGGAAGGDANVGLSASSSLHTRMCRPIVYASPLQSGTGLGCGLELELHSSVLHATPPA
jgi:hypothetical protein